MSQRRNALTSPTSSNAATSKIFLSSFSYQANHLICNSSFVDSHLKPYKCEVRTCEDPCFSSAACLLRHEREAHAMHDHGDKPFPCTYESCERGIPGNGFSRHWNLIDHMKRAHHDLGQPAILGRGGAFPCLKPDCGESFPIETSRTHHHTIHHQTELLHQCFNSDCNQKFRTKQELRSHRRTHYKDLCTVEGCASSIPGKGFKSEQGLRCHIAQAHKTSTDTTTDTTLQS
jgi:hypothetical protein